MRMRKFVLFCVAALTVLCVASCEPEPIGYGDRYGWDHHQHQPSNNQGDNNQDDNNQGNNNQGNNNQGNNNQGNNNQGNNNQGDNNQGDNNQGNNNQGNNNQGDNNQGNNNQGDNNQDVNNNPSLLTITRLYSVVMRREIPWPFKAYVMQVSDGNYFYMLRLRYDKELHVGDQISFGVFSFCPHEIARINGVDVGDVTDTPEYNQNVDAGEYLIATDPIEGTVKHLFSMEIRYMITFWPIDTLFLELENGDLIYVKKSKLESSINIGDRIVYSVYTLFPNEVVNLKKL